MIEGLICAWILSWFGFDEMVVEVVTSFGYNFTASHYYVLSALIGLIIRREF